MSYSLPFGDFAGLNFLTQAHILHSLKNETKTGERVQLDWKFNGWKQPGFGRSASKHEIVDLKHLGFVANDGARICILSHTTC